MKIVINRCHGGFGLSDDALNRYIELKGLKLYLHKSNDWKFTQYTYVPYEEYEKVFQHDANKNTWEGKDEGVGRYKASNDLCWNDDVGMKRNDPILVQVVQELGDKANGRHSELKIVEIPDDVEWEIAEYDGLEWVAEKHRTWE